MCRNAILHHRDGSETVCRCQGDLHEAMPRGVWFFPPAGEPDIEGDGYEPEVCLCPVDIKRTARENGYRVSRYAPDGSEDAFDDHLYLDCGWRFPINVCANGKRPQTPLSAVCTVASDLIVRAALDPLIAYVEEQEALPVGYRQAIRGYRQGKYGSVELRSRFDAIDGAAAFCRYGGEYAGRMEESKHQISSTTPD